MTWSHTLPLVKLPHECVTCTRNTKEKMAVVVGSGKKKGIVGKRLNSENFLKRKNNETKTLKFTPGGHTKEPATTVLIRFSPKKDSVVALFHRFWLPHSKVERRFFFFFFLTHWPEHNNEHPGHFDGWANIHVVGQSHFSCFFKRGKKVDDVH